MSQSLALYVLSEQYQSLLALQDTDDLPPEVVRDTLDALEGAFEDKAVAVAHVIENLAASAMMIKTRADAQLLRAERLLARSDSLRAYLQFHLLAVGKKKIVHDDFDIVLQDNPPRVIVDDETQIPDTYKVQPETPPKRVDKQAIAKAIKAGTEVPGAHTETGQSVRIKP